MATSSMQRRSLKGWVVKYFLAFIIAILSSVAVALRTDAYLPIH